MTDSLNLVGAITDGPIVTENITIDAHYRFTKEIAELKAKLAIAKEVLKTTELYSDQAILKGFARGALAEINGTED